MNMEHFQAHKTVVSLIDFICQKYPNHLALVLEGQQLTYGELQQRAEQLYNSLTRQGLLKPNSLVGLCLEPSFEMVIAIYAILKAGAAFVPLDPDLPSQRLSYMIFDAQLTTILTQQKFAFDIEPAMRRSSLNGHMYFLDTPIVEEQLITPSVAVPVVEPEQLAYIIYTSGSTGEPKGVMIEHRGLLNLALASRSTFDIQPGLRILQFASISFDAAVYELMIALCSGATLVLGAREQMLPGQLLFTFLITHQVQMLTVPPSVLATLTQFRDQLSDLQLVVVAGEACPLSLAKAWVSPNTRFFNAYGPTEITVCATMYEFKPQDVSLPIGYALPNVELYVLDEELRICNRGQKGELYIGGIGLGKGYLGKPKITGERFLDNPFGSDKIYKTGDIVYEDLEHLGLLHYVGRSDNQVKIRGKRVELEAIEMVLAQHPGIQINAVKVVKTVSENSSTSVLVAYIVPRQGQFLTEKRLQRFAAELLPDYMVPARFVFMDELPVLPNRSKVDRKALPDLPQLPSFVASPTDNAVKIATIFDEALDLPAGSCTSSTHFFHIGGDSLRIAHVLCALKRDFGVTLPSRLVYEHPTPSDLAQLLEQFKLKNECASDDQQIDLQAETKLSLNLDTSIWQAPPQTKYDCALITGVTGFLGSHLLYELLHRGSYRKIYCLVRAESDLAAIARLRATFIQYQLPTAGLVFLDVIAGDIQQPQLQLPAALYDKLGEEVDQIYHLAADTNYIKPDSEMRKSNIDGTANVIALAAHRRHKTLHYVSSVAVYGAVTSLLGINEVSENYNIDLSAPIMSVESAYVRAKWVAEQMVRKAQEKGLAVSIYRPGFISGHRQTKVANLNDMFYRFIQGCLQMGMYPDLSEKYWFVVPVDYVAAAIAHISLDVKHTGGNYNIVVPREQELSHLEIFEFMNKLGYPLEKISLKNWLNTLSNISPANPLHPLVSFIQEKVYQNRSTILEVHHRTPICKIDNTLRAIEGSGIECPKIDKAQISQYLPNFVKGLRQHEQLSLSCIER